MSKTGQGLQLQPPESKEEGGSWGAGPPILEASQLRLDWNRCLRLHQ